jgi:hypothetical protein
LKKEFLSRSEYFFLHTGRTVTVTVSFVFSGLFVGSPLQGRETSVVRFSVFEREPWESVLFCSKLLEEPLNKFFLKIPELLAKVVNVHF